mgnify:CR=1 FL=1
MLLREEHIAIALQSQFFMTSLMQSSVCSTLGVEWIDVLVNCFRSFTVYYLVANPDIVDDIGKGKLDGLVGGLSFIIVELRKSHVLLSERKVLLIFSI